ncbi:MAG: ATP-binding cassette domain-containing protein [Defluviitaleaceae bacterium]|nr:ATP-binding cassette domain-containing protein [Defluviitaleaceae bacterium]
MIDISVHELNKYYGSNHVLRGINFEIYKGEKVGLLGKNGSGKTTLFKIITEDEPYDSGSLSKASGRRVEILAQIPVFDEKDTVEDILRSSFHEISEIYGAMKKIENWSFASQTTGPCGQGDSNPIVLARYGKLMEEYERLGGYDIETKIEKICNGMNIGNGMRSSLFHLLSGGEKTRVNLARILLRDCDILLLDEPTNHLDLTSLSWLENFIREFSGTVVIISHDRVFLDNVVSRIIEIDDGIVNFYSGNYTFYVEERQRRYQTQAEQYKQQQKKIEQLETAIKRQRVWAAINPSNTGLAKRALAMERRIEQMDKVDKPLMSRKMTEDFNSGGHAAKEVVSFDSVSKSYGSNMLLDDVSLSIGRNNRIALIGANGCGKTTLLKLIMGEELCESGALKVSSNIKIAYMSQIIVFDDENATVFETLQNQVSLPEEKLRSILARFRFRTPDVIKKVRNLSGGEKSRLKLCLLMQNQANFLILDEPTNHLDIESREWIEDAVADFNGTMLFISHDRFFLNRFASKIWSMKDGKITVYDGDFEEYLQSSAIINSQPSITPSKNKKKKPAAPSKEKPKETIPFEALIYEAEAELTVLDKEIELHLTDSDYEKMNLLYQKKYKLEEHIASLYDDWARENGGYDNE